MSPLLIRHVIYPLHERLLGRATMRYARELERSQWWSPMELRRVQEQKLQRLLQHSVARVPSYRRRLVEAGINPDSRDSRFPLSRMADIPLLSKRDIREGGAGMVWSGAPGGVFSLNTGGSTGEPLPFLVDRRRQAFDQAARARAHRWFHIEWGDRELYLWGSPIEHRRTDRLRRWRDGLTNHRLLNAFSMSPRRMDEYLRQLERFQPRCLFGYPSGLSLLAEHGRAIGRRVRLSSLRAVFVTGEVCHPHHRKTLETYFGVPVVDGYGSREAGFIAHQCPEGSMHITAENVVIEIIRDGAPVPEGSTGEIIVTHLDAYAMPFIRYRTGDLGRLIPGRCPCGRGLPLMDVVQGRTTDFLYLPDGSIRHALSIIYPLRDMAGVRRFQVLQERDYSVTIKIERMEGSPLTAAEAARAVQPVLGDQVDVRVDLVDEIPASDSGKFRYVMSRAQPVTDVHEKPGDGRSRAGAEDRRRAVREFVPVNHESGTTTDD